jgi:hypothetical protein
MLTIFIVILCYVNFTGGLLCVDGELTIRTEFEKSSSGLREFAAQHQRWSDGDGDFDFAKVFSGSPPIQSSRQYVNSFKDPVIKGIFDFAVCYELAPVL